MKNYNGWTNWDTWNANLWITNGELSYMLAKECKTIKELKKAYSGMIKSGLIQKDNVKINQVDFGQILKNLID